jgi:ABC-type branched-subunit amino acid transport system substrate-binding protein
MKSRFHSRLVVSLVGLVALSSALTTPSFAQSANGKEILIGQTADFSGVQAGPVKEMTDAAYAYFDKVNKAGGVAGRKISLVSLDDKYDPKLSVRHAKTLADKGVLAIILGRGTANAEAIIPVVSEEQVPVVGYVGGSTVLHAPVKKFFFNLRPPYRLEVERAIGQLVAQGASRIAAVYTDDAFGTDAVAGFNEGMKEVKLTPAVVTTIPRGDAKVDAAVANLMAANANAIVGLCIPKSCAALVKALHKAGYTGRFLSLSNTSSTSYVKELGDVARGVIVTQVFPSPHSIASAVSNEFQKLASDYKLPLTYTSMEGFINAKVLVEAIKRSGTKPTRDSLLAALNGMSKLDFGGYAVSFSASNHTASDHVYLTIIGKDGKFLQ